MNPDYLEIHKTSLFKVAFGLEKRVSDVALIPAINITTAMDVARQMACKLEKCVISIEEFCYDLWTVEDNTPLPN